jgi:molybdate transport system regulatory protein
MNAVDRSAESESRQHVCVCIEGLTLRSKQWIEVHGRFAIGEGGADLLKAIDAEGSLTAGARRIGWSYRHAWGYVRRAESVLGVTLLSNRPGKGQARGSVLTREGHDLVATLLAIPRPPLLPGALTSKDQTAAPEAI